jgi:hypothetical protein
LIFCNRRGHFSIMSRDGITTAGLDFLYCIIKVCHPKHSPASIQGSCEVWWSIEISFHNFSPSLHKIFGGFWLWVASKSADPVFAGESEKEFCNRTSCGSNLISLDYFNMRILWLGAAYLGCRLHRSRQSTSP